MAGSRYFSFMQRPDQEFIFELTDPAKIQQALDILSGKEKVKVHVMGRIVKSKKPYNPNWDYHLDPATISFFDQGVEAGNANMEYVNSHLAEVGGMFLPAGLWFPWDSRLLKEVTP